VRQLAAAVGRRRLKNIKSPKHVNAESETYALLRKWTKRQQAAVLQMAFRNQGRPTRSPIFNGNPDGSSIKKIVNEWDVPDFGFLLLL
jgi:hypothetical protein